MADATPASETADNPLADLVRRAIKAHPVLNDQKKLFVRAVGPNVRIEGLVFTRDMLRQVQELAARLPDPSRVSVSVDAEIKPPQNRPTVGRIPQVSQGPSNVDPRFSMRHVRPPRGA